MMFKIAIIDDCNLTGASSYQHTVKILLFQGVSLRKNLEKPSESFLLFDQKNICFN